MVIKFLFIILALFENLVEIVINNFLKVYNANPRRFLAFNITIIGRAITLERELSKKEQRFETKKDQKRIKSDNFTRTNREKSNIAIK